MRKCRKICISLVFSTHWKMDFFPFIKQFGVCLHWIEFLFFGSTGEICMIDSYQFPQIHKQSTILESSQCHQKIKNYSWLLLLIYFQHDDVIYIFVRSSNHSIHTHTHSYFFAHSLREWIICSAKTLKIYFNKMRQFTRHLYQFCAMNI